MSEYEYMTVVEWKRKDADFVSGCYSRGHHWLFDGGIEVPASASPHLVPLPLSVAAAVDPEEAFVASLASCHMLLFLSLASRREFVVESYRDEAVGILARDQAGALAMTRVTLHPEVRFDDGRWPANEEIIALHHESHTHCFIARSVKTEVRCEPLWISAPPTVRRLDAAPRRI